MTTALPYFDPLYIAAAQIVDKYIEARNKDFLPDVQTEEILGMGRGPVGHKLLGAFKTLHLQGRFSRTQIEQALVYSPDHYPGYIKTLICSLPPSARSRCASDLYNNKFNGVHWEMIFYNNIHVNMFDSGVRNFLKPALPLGDDRHSPKMKAIAEIASTFHDAFAYGCIFQSSFPPDVLDDVLAPIDPDYPEMVGLDLFDRYGALFGIHKDCLVLTGSRERSSYSESEIILRAFYILYLKERLSKTELEHALLNGPKAMELLFTNGIRLCKLFPGSKEDDAFQSVIINQAEKLSSFDFAEMGDDFVNESDANDVECDYCGKQTEKLENRCSQCHVAFYCGKDCQEKDWKRHRPLCLLMKAKLEDADSKDS